MRHHGPWEFERVIDSDGESLTVMSRDDETSLILWQPITSPCPECRVDQLKTECDCGYEITNTINIHWSEADAKLIAAAPTMQEALEHVINVYQQPQYHLKLHDVLSYVHRALVVSGFFDETDKEIKEFMDANKKATTDGQAKEDSSGERPDEGS